MSSNDTSDTDSTSTEETPENVRRSDRIKHKVSNKKKNKVGKSTKIMKQILNDTNSDEEDVENKTGNKQNTVRKRISRVSKKVLNPAEKFYDKYHEHFYFKLSSIEKKIIADKEQEVHTTNFGNVPIRFRILQSKMDTVTKCSVLDKIAPLLKDSHMCSEIPKLQKWADTVLRIPFGVLRHPPVTNKSGIQVIKNILTESKQDWTNMFTVT